MSKEGKLNEYCRNIIYGVFKSHPYFLRAVKENGTVDVKDFQIRYKKFLDKLSLSERQKDILLSRSGSQGHQYTLEELGKKYDLTRERIREIESKSHRLVRGGVYFQGHFLDSFYLEEYDTALRSDLPLRGFDPTKIKEMRNGLEQYAEWDRLGISISTYNSLRRNGVNTIDELKKVDDGELLKIIGQSGLKEIREKIQKIPVPQLPDDLRNLELPERIYRILRRGGIIYISELEKMGDNELLNFRNLGQRKLANIKEQLRKYRSK